MSALDTIDDDTLTIMLRRLARLLCENDDLRSLVELMAMRIPIEHMPKAEATLLTDILGN